MTKPIHNQPATLFAVLDDCLLKDRFTFIKRINGAKRIADKTKQQAALDTIAQAMAISLQTRQMRANTPLKIEYPPQLPVSQKRDDIFRALSENQVIIVAGETGSGKTTQLPKICLELGLGIKGLIGHTQPRRIAARAVASRLSEELGCQIGQAVGYQVRFSDHSAPQSRVKLMTDGILLAEIAHDKYLNKYDCIIIDEAHERSLNIDFILGYLKQLLPKRPDLKVIITSATIDPQRFSSHFNNAPIISVSGRTYPVEVRYRPVLDEENDGERDLQQAIFDAVDELIREAPGDILIFMSGEREIRDLAQALNKRELRDTEILPLYARLAAHEQNRVFQSHIGRRIVLATNVAETSLTVPGIKYVIDPGLARISRYSHRTKVQRLPIEPISQASANQRKGRCGRVSDGICIRLYSQEDFANRSEFTDPEIARTNLASVILHMLWLGLGEISTFPFVEAPDNRHINDGVKLLEELGAVKQVGTSRPQLTAIGKVLAQLPIDPRLARMVVEANKQGALAEVMVIVAALSIQDPRERPNDKQQAADEKHRRFADQHSDFATFINLWRYLKEQQKAQSSNQFRQMCKKEFLNYLRVREWQDLHSQIRQVVQELGYTINQQPASAISLHTSLLAGLLSHIGNKEPEKNEYLGARNRHFHLFPTSSLFKNQPKWLMAAELIETSRLWGTIAAKIEPEWVEPLAEHLLKRSYSEPHWREKMAAVFAFEKVTLYGLTLVAKRAVNYGAIDAPLSREIFIRSALIEGQWRSSHSFLKLNRQLLEEVQELEHKSRRKDLLISDDQLFDFYDQRIDHSVVSGRHFDDWWKTASKLEPDLLNFEKNMLFATDADHITEHDHPNFWQQGQFKLKLQYQFDPGHTRDGVTVVIPVAILNQIAPQGFDWQIPALRHELVVALIKSLPKPLRRHFVPAPNYASAFLARVPAQQEPLLDALEKTFKQMSGVTIAREDWQLSQLPDHLKMRFLVVDERQKPLKEGNSLHELKSELKPQIQQALSLVADDDIERGGLKSWNFGNLEPVFEQKRAGWTMKAFPALVDEKNSVAIKLFETEDEQKQMMQQGLRRLLLLNIPSPIKYLHENLPNKSKLGLYFATYGNVSDVIDDCIACAIDKLITAHGGLAWDEQQFQQLRALVEAELGDTVLKIAKQVEQILTLSFSINKKLKGRVDFTLAFAMSDIKAQLDALIFKGFVAKSGWQRLADIERYLNAIERRLEKLPIDPNRDRLHMLKIDAATEQYKHLLARIPKGRMVPDEVIAIRWMIEELRVSFFAQQLGTAHPISDKRILHAINEVKLT